MKKWIAGLIALFVPSVLVLANPFNSWQTFQPFKSAFIASTGSTGYPDAGNIIINTGFDGSLVSSVGPNPTFTRSLLRNYSASTSTITEVATTVPAFGATMFGGTSSLASGISIEPDRENLILQSEDFTTTWTAIATGSATANTADSPITGVDTLADTISGSATGDGVQQDSGLTSTNSGWPASPTTAWLFSVYLKDTTSTQLVDLRITDSAGTTQEAKTQCRTTTTWRRCEVFQQFTSTPVGTVIVKIIVGNTNTTRAFGAMLQRAGSTGYGNLRGRANAGEYVKTTTTTKFANTDQVSYPSATVDLARTTGTISMMVRPGDDATSINEGNLISYFSVSGEKLAFDESSASQAVFYINDSPVTYDVPGTADQGMGGLRKGAWNHVIVAWDDTNNVRKIFINGQKFAEDTNAFTTWAGGADLYLGQHSGLPSYWNSGSTFRNFVMWDSFLTDGQATATYNLEMATFAETYATGLLFSVDLGVTAAPTVAGDYRYWYDGTLVPTTYSGTTGQASIPTWSTSTTYAGFTGHNKIPLPAYPQGNSNATGMQMSGFNKNIMLQSTAPGTTWTAVGAPVITNAVGNMFGANMPYGTIAGVANDGISQTNASYACADNGFVASVYVSTGAGTLNGNVTLEGSTGASQTISQAFTATTTPTRYEIYKLFTGSCAGNVTMKVTLAGTGTLNVSGMQVERRNTGGANYTNNVEAATVFIKTTTAEIEVRPNYLWYNTAGNINPLTGTIIIWATLEMDSAKIANSDGPNLISVAGDSCSFDFHYVSDNLNFCMGGNGGIVSTKAVVGALKDVWHQYGVTYSCTVAGACSTALYFDGNLEDSDTATGIKPSMWGRFVLGAGIPGQLATDHWKGLMKETLIYGQADGSLITTDWTNNKAAHGR